jgi:transcriptional regulator with XRE-family HTH domain
MDVMVAETTPAPAIPVDSKAVIRCQKCQLNQFMTRQGNCRRCHRPLLNEEPPVMVHEFQPAQSAQSAGPARPSVDMATAIWLLRSARGLSQRAMAKKMGIARTYISKLEGNRCVPSPGQIRRIAATLEVSEYCLVALATVHHQFASRQQFDDALSVGSARAHASRQHVADTESLGATA